jgi:hypothetical protein
MRHSQQSVRGAAKILLILPILLTRARLINGIIWEEAQTRTGATLRCHCKCLI